MPAKPGAMGSRQLGDAAALSPLTVASPSFINLARFPTFDEISRFYLEQETGK
ncbi:MAG: hypothetical protein AB1830_00880 [Pseudomonadota bacterium]